MAGTTADKLNKLKQTKADFKTTMTDMGLDVTDELPFGDYPGLLLDAGSMKKITVRVTVGFYGYQQPYGIFEVGDNGTVKFVWGGNRKGTYTHTTYAGFPMITPRKLSAISGSLTSLGATRIKYDTTLQSNNFNTDMYAYILGDSDMEVEVE